MIRVYDMNGLLADVEMIDGKMHVVSYSETLKDFEDLRSRQAVQNAVLKAKREGNTKPISELEIEPVSDQELYDSLPDHFGHHMWCERID